jgi:hypothetical protein
MATGRKARKRNPRIPPRYLRLAEELAALYLDLTKRSGKPINPKRLWSLVRFAALAVDCGEDPRIVLYGFLSLNLFQPVGYKRLTDMREVRKVVKLSWRYMPSWGSEVGKMAEPMDPHLEIVHVSESIKKSSSSPADCLRSLRWTGGYHPSSAECQGCPLQVECAGALEAWVGVDLSRLRTLPQAEAVAFLSKIFPDYPSTPFIRERQT